MPTIFADMSRTAIAGKKKFWDRIDNTITYIYSPSFDRYINNKALEGA